MGLITFLGVISPFPFYYWKSMGTALNMVNLRGNGRDPCKIMAMVAHFLKVVQFVALFSVSTLSWPPPFYFWPVFIFG